MSDIEASESRPVGFVPTPQSPSLGGSLRSLLAVPPILAVAAWLIQSHFAFPPGSSGASLTALGLVIGIAVPIVSFPIAITKLVRLPASRTFGNVAITILAGIFAGLAVLVALALLFR